MKIIFFISLSLLWITSFSQLEVKESIPKTTIGKVSTGKGMLAELYYKAAGQDTIYFLTFRNEEYAHIVDYQVISFSAPDSTLEKLYTLVKSVFLDENKKNKDYQVELTLGRHDIIIANFRFMGATSAMVHTDKGHFFLKENQVDKLFNK